MPPLKTPMRNLPRPPQRLAPDGSPAEGGGQTASQALYARARETAVEDGPGIMSEREQFLARMKASAAEPVTTEEDLYGVAGQESPLDAADTGKLTHTSPGLIYMWRQEHYGWKRVRVVAKDAVALMDAGYMPNCPDCGAYCDEGPNSCPGRAKMAYRQCPEPTCPKRIYDIQEQVDKGEAEEGEIKDASYNMATPELRTKARLDAHIRAFHETLAFSLGLMRGDAQREAVSA